MILSFSGTILIDPYAEGNTTNYITYWKRDARNTAAGFQCDFVDDRANSPARTRPRLCRPLLPDDLRTYRLALAADNEYCVAVGSNTVAGSLAAEVLIMNRITPRALTEISQCT